VFGYSNNLTCSDVSVTFYILFRAKGIDLNSLLLEEMAKSRMKNRKMFVNSSFALMQNFSIICSS